MKMNLGMLGLLATCCALAPVILAKPLVGEQAPDLGDVEWVVNAPETDSLEHLKGDVVVIEFWGAC